MFLFIVFFAAMLAGCTTMEATNNQQPSAPYYAKPAYPPTSSYIRSKNQAYYKGKGLFAWPVNGKIVNSYGQYNGGTTNKGINIQADPNSTIHAASDGTVVFASHVKGWGNTLIIAHNSNIYTVYANLKNITAKNGHSVRKGDSIGQADSISPRSSMLHFEIRNGHQPQNPMRYLN